MHKPLPFLALVSAAGITFSILASPSLADMPSVDGIIVAADEKAAPPGGVSDGPPADPAGVLKPKTYKETPSEVAQCEKTWDPQTGMSKEEYEASCKRTLKYFPEKDN